MAAREKLRKAMEFLLEKIGGEKCAATLEKVKEKLDAEKPSTERPAKVEGKPPVNRDDAEATALAGEDFEMKPEDRTLDVKADGT